MDPLTRRLMMTVAGQSSGPTPPPWPPITMTAGNAFDVISGYYPIFSIGSVSVNNIGPVSDLTILITQDFGEDVIALIIGFSGDKMSVLSGITTIWVDGTPYEVNEGPQYEGETDSTFIGVFNFPFMFVDSQTYEINIGE